jgi:hypothetical protein
MVGVVGAISLILQLVMAGWDNRNRGPWGKPITFLEILAEWGIYMIIFLLLTLVIEAAFRFGCSTCGR